MPKNWSIDSTDQYLEWFDTKLDEAEQNAVVAAVEKLQEFGPALRRPLVGNIDGSAFPNMKELIPPRGNIRILFAFDPERTAFLLVGGDKTDQWVTW